MILCIGTFEAITDNSFVLQSTVGIIDETREFTYDNLVVEFAIMEHIWSIISILYFSQSSSYRVQRKAVT